MHENKTMKPKSHVLVVSADPAWRDEVVAGLNAAAGKLDNPFELLAVRGHERAVDVDPGDVVHVDVLCDEPMQRI